MARRSSEPSRTWRPSMAPTSWRSPACSSSRIPRPSLDRSGALAAATNDSLVLVRLTPELAAGHIDPRVAALATRPYRQQFIDDLSSAYAFLAQIARTYHHIGSRGRPLAYEILSFAHDS